MRRHSTVPPIILVLALAACDETADAPLRPDIPEPPVENVPAAAPRAPGAEGYRIPPDEIRTGFIMGRDGITPKEITYEVYGGVAVWEGDIVLGPANAVPATRAELLRLVPRRGQPDAAQGVVIDGAGFRWTNGIVPYEIDGALPNQARVTGAIAMVEEATAGIDLVPRSGEADFIRFTTGDGCASPIGRQGGQQNIILDDDCSTGNAAHEIIHSLGLFHEHTRCDRDDFVTINLANVEAGKEHNFDKQCDDATDFFEYDEGSMMHYGTHAFSSNGMPTIESKRGLDDLMGQRDALGTTDIQTLNELYGAFNDPPVAVIAPLAASYPEGTPIGFDGSGSSDPDDAVLTWVWSFGDGTCSATPAPALCTQESPTKTYADNGSYAVSLTVSDGFLNDTDNATATITNVAPVVSAGPDATATSGDTYSFSGSFVDAGIVDDPWTWEIDWGSGPNTTGSTNDQSAAIEATHQVCSAGEYSVVLTVTDKDGGVGSDFLTLTVPYFGVDLDISPGGTPNSVNLGKKGMLPIGILSTATFDATQLDPATLVLGDELGTETPVAQRNNGTWHATTEDVNGDGLTDLVVKFDVPALVANGDLTAASTTVVLRGFVNDGCTNIRGTGPVTIRP